MTLIASFMEIIVKRDMASSLRSSSFPSKCQFFIFSMKKGESLIKEFVFPTKGFNLLARNFTSLYIGDPLVSTMGRRGIPNLWILGSP